MIVQKIYRHIENSKEEIRIKVKKLLKELYNYTDDNNPFGDPELSKPFVWEAKIKSLSKKGLNAELDCDALEEKLTKAKEEIEKMRRKKLKREEEKFLARQIYNNPEEKGGEEMYKEWLEKDEKFYLSQEKLRMELRIKEGREKPIDFLHKVIMIWKGYYPLPSNYSKVNEYDKPYLIFNLLSEKELSELYDNIITQLAIEKDRLLNSNFVYCYFDIKKNFKIQLDLKLNDVEEFIDYWSALLVLCESYLYNDKNVSRLNSIFKQELSNIVKNKSFDEVYNMELEAQKAAEEATSGEDHEYWSNTVNYLKYHRCVLVLSKLGKAVLEKSILEEDKNKVIEENALPQETSEYIYYDKLGNKVEINYNNNNGEFSPTLYFSDDETKNNNKLKAVEYTTRLENARKKILANLIDSKIKQINSLAESLHMNKLCKRKSNVKSITCRKMCNYNQKQNVKLSQNKNRLVGNNFKSTVRMAYNKLNEENTKRLRLGKRRQTKTFQSEKSKDNNVINNNKESTYSSRIIEINKMINESSNNKAALDIQNINKIEKSENVNTNTDNFNFNNTKANSNLNLNSMDNLKKSDKTESDSDSNSELDKLLGKKKNNLNISKSKNVIETKDSNESIKSLMGNRFLIVDSNYEENAYKKFERLEKEENENEITLKETQYPIQAKDYTWAAIYKPRKPRYINRVKTGYEWNKYYQKHYDYDNPPPKVIQGYKFNIFYPDLIDKTNTPQYSIERSDIKDTCILRFSAGAPYEDISFNIVNREWDMNEKSGFKNYFDRGIYYLYFNFKRFRYKR